MKNFTELKAGDVRKEGDVFIRKFHNEASWLTARQLLFGLKYPVTLLGHVILPSDLIADAFYRPLK